jgi:hypothetical protein
MLTAVMVTAMTPSIANPASCTARQPAHLRGLVVAIIG